MKGSQSKRERIAVLLGLRTGKLKPEDVLPKNLVKIFTWFNQLDGTIGEEFSLDGSHKEPPEGYATTRPSWWDAAKVEDQMRRDNDVIANKYHTLRATEQLPLLSKKERRKLAKQLEKEQQPVEPVIAPQTYRLIASVNAFSITDYGEVRDRLMETVNRNFNRR